MKQRTRRKIFSGLAYVSMFVQTFFPWGLVGLTYAQEATVSATLESPTSTITPLISPEVTPEITPLATPSATPEVTPEITPLATPSASFSKTIASLGEKREYINEIEQKNDKDYVKGEVIVRFKKEKLDTQGSFGKVKAYIFEKKFALEKTDEIKSSNIQVFKSKKSTEEMVNELKSDPKVEYAEPNYLRYPAIINTNDTYKDLLWGLDNTGQVVNSITGTNDDDIDAPESWVISEGNGIIVAIIDSGVAYNHPDLVNSMWNGNSCKDENGVALEGCNHGFDFEDNDRTPLPTTSSHGTHIAGTIAAEKNNNKGIIGVAPEVKIMALKYDFNVATEIKAIDFAIQNGAKVINASFGGGSFSQSEYDAINRFNDAGGIFVAAAMNNATNNESVHVYPSDYDLENIISVAATDQNDNLASFSNYGSISVDVGAPGKNIYSTVADSIILYETFDGLTVPDVPSNWIKGSTLNTNKWATYDFADGYWDKVLYGQVPSFPYDNNADTTITSSAFDLNNSGSNISFWAACDTEYKTDGWYDYMALEYSSDGVNFYPADDPFYAGEEFRWDEPTFDILNGDSLDSSGSSVLHYEDILIPSQYLTSNFKFRFRWVSNSSDNYYDGCLVDDVKITKYSDGFDEIYGYMSGTSMATPHVAGLAGLIWAYQPGLTTSQVKDVILSTGDPVTDLAGKTVSGKRINAYNALDSLESPTITGISDDSVPTKSKTWNWDSTDATDTYRYLIDQTEGSVPSGPYGSDKTATQASGDGTYYLHVQAKSDVGAESAVTTVSALLDNTASVMNIISPLSGAVASGSSIVGFSNTEEVNPECSVNNSDWVSCASGVTTLSNLTGFDSLPETTFSLYVRETDVAGNVGSDTESGIVKDSVNPTGSITNPANGLTFADNPSFTATASDTNGVVSVKFQYKVTSSGSFSDINTDSSAPFEADWSGISLVSNTTYDLQVIVEDAAGNLSTFTGVSFTYDVTAPSQPVITGPSSAVTVNRDSYSIEGTAEADSLVKIYSSLSVVGSQQLSSGATTFSVSVVLTQDAANSFEVSSTDAVGNESIKSTVSVITEDSTNPGIDSYTLDNSIISPEVSVGIKDTASIDLLFSESVDYLISIKDGGDTTVRSWSGSDVTNPQVKVWDGKDTGGSYVADGTYIIEVVITDEAGNSITDTSKTITVNNVPLILDSIGNKNIDEGVLLTFTAVASNSEGNAVNYALSSPPTGATIGSSTGAFSWTPTEAQGPANYTLSVNATSGDLSDSEEITITVNEVNVDPVANSQSVSTDEDVSKIITLSATDVDLPENDLAYSILSGPTHGSVDLTGAIATYTPAENYNGPDSFTFQVDDSPAVLASLGLISSTSFGRGDDFLKTFGFNSFELASVPPNTATISITVDPINDAPTITSSAPTTATEDILYSYDASSEDPDGPSAIWSTTASDDCGGVIDSSTGVYTFTPAGPIPPVSCVLEIMVSDGGSPDLSAIQTETITITPVNGSPVLDPIGNKSVNELTELTFIAHATDPDSSLTYSLTGAGTPAGATIIGDTGVFSFTPTEAQGPDSYTLTVNVTDGNSTDSEEITITVNEVNVEPVANADTATTPEDISKDITLTASDSDLPAQSLIYAIVSTPTHGSVDLTDALATYTPAENYTGADSFTFKANDGDLDSNTATISITVTAVNDAPSFDAIADQVVDEDSSSQDIAVTNVSPGPTNESGQTVTLTATSSDTTIISNPSMSGIGTTRTLTYTPSTNKYGAVTVTVTADDGQGLNNSFSRTFSITVISVNDAPTITSSAPSTATEDTLYTYNATSEDSDGPGATWSTTASDDCGGVIDSSTGVYTFTPAGPIPPVSCVLAIKVNDGGTPDLTATQTETITITPVNDNPTANDGSATTSEDNSVEITLSGSDDDGDSLTYAIVDNPTHGTLGSIATDKVTYTPSENYNGSDSFTFKANDGSLTDTATVSITITPVNDAPVLSTIGNRNLDEFATLTINVNAVDIDNTDIIYTTSTLPANASIDSVSGVFTFIPDESQGGNTYSITFTVSDGLLTDEETISIDVNEVNSSPVAVNDSGTMTEDSVLTIDTGTLLSNDYDLDTNTNAGLTVTAVNTAINGTVGLLDSTITFTPNANFSGSASFNYVVSDGSLTDIGTVNITIDPVNDDPVLEVIGDRNVDEFSTLDFTITASDIDSSNLQFTTSALPDNASFNSDNQTFTFTPNELQGGQSYQITFTVSDGSLSDSETITITVNEVNNAPTITSSAPTTATEDTLYTYDASSEDPDGPDATWSTTASDTCGGIIDSSTGVYTFTPAGPIPPVSCELGIEVNDGGTPDLVATQTETITITPVNGAPSATADSYTTPEDTTLNIESPGVLSNDSDDDSLNLSAVLVSDVSDGSLTLNADGSFTYAPNTNHNGSDSFTYMANDGDLDSNTVTVSLTITPVNDAPTVVNDTASVNEDTILTIAKADLLTNDSDIDGDSFSLTAVSDAVNGSVVIDGTDVKFTPTANYFGSASFDYTVSDGNLTSTATVNITVNSVPDNPVANDGSTTTSEDNSVEITLSGSDVDGDSLTYSIISTPTNGTLGSIATDKVTYTPSENFNGSDSFTFKANDGGLDSNTATISITVDPVNDAPVLDFIGNKSVDELTNLTFTATASDPDNSLTYSLIDAPTGATIGSDTGSFSFTPTEAQGPDDYILTISVTDGNSTDSEEITITVNEVNVAPVATDNGVSTNEDTEVTITLGATDSDLPGQTLTYSIVSGVSHGVLGSIIGNQLTYTPTANYNGDDSFTFKTSDGSVDSNTATITITVNPVNDTPSAVNDTASVDEDNILTVSKADLLSNDSDIDGDSFTLTSVSGAVNGSVVIDGTDVKFTPMVNYNGSASFDYTISDGSLTDTATVTVTVSPVNDTPVANNGSVTTSQDDAVEITLSASDIDDDSLTYLIVTGVSHGTLGSITGNKVTYTPTANYTGADSFTFKTNDSSVDSNTATISITVNPPPVISSETTNTPSETSITITWITDHPSTSRVIYDTVSHAVLDVAPNYGYANSTVEADNSPKVTSHSVTVSGLNASTTYYYRVVSHGSPEVVGDESTFKTENITSNGGEVAGTSVSSSSTDSPTCSDQKPDSAPVLVSVISNGPNEATLIWRQAKDPVTYYLIAFGTSSGEMLYGNPNVGGKETTSYTIRGLSSGTRYYFKVRAGNNCMPGDYSNEISIRVSGESLSEVPEGFSPDVLGEETTAEDKVLGEDITSPTPEILSEPRTQSNKNLLRTLIGLGIVIISSSYIFLTKRKKNKKL